MGLGLSILTAIATQAKKKGLSDKELHLLATVNGEMFIDQLIDELLLTRKFPSLLTAAGDVPKGYRIVEDIEKPIDFKGKKIKPVYFLEPSREQYVDGWTMSNRAKLHNAKLGLADGRYLKDHPELVPVEMLGWRILLPGTHLIDGHKLYYPTLTCHKGGGEISFSSLDAPCGFLGKDCLIRCE